MRYMGAKTKYAKYIVPILQKTIDEHGIETYIEPFVGGACLIDKVRCAKRIGYDRSDTLIALLSQMRDDFDKVLKSGSKELWETAKSYGKTGIKPENMSLADIGAMEFFASFCNGGFPRGYAKNSTTRNYYNEAYRNAKEQAPNLKGIEFKCQDYLSLETGDKPCVILNDPPYQGTKIYGYSNQPAMDYAQFWDWVRELSKNNYVFTCEQSAPDDFEIVWEKDVIRTTNITNDFKAVERLYRWKDGLK